MTETVNEAVAGTPDGTGLDAGTYEVLRARLSEQAAELGRRAGTENQKADMTRGHSQRHLLYWGIPYKL